ncbi:MAG: hypothetical protein H0V17_23300, partial [Deltaproteobacteria bacterium]|nr:hypothetical protein [Deltaproteobacteria bacterium]
ARLVDVAPTIAALLGIPAPGHGHGRALVELLRLDRPAIDARIAADAERLAIARDVPVDPSGPNALHLAIVGATLLLAILLAVLLRPAIQIPLTAWVGAIAWVYLLIVMVAACRGNLSPSEVPALWRLQRILAVCGAGGIAMQVVASWHIVRRRRARLATANGIALVGLVVALVPLFAIRSWFVLPHIEVPEPEWLVAIPAVELAAAVTCVAIAAHLAFELAVSLRGRQEHGVAR